MLDFISVTISYISGNTITYIVTDKEKDRLSNFVSRYKQDDDDGIRLDPFYCMDVYPKKDSTEKPKEIWINVGNIEVIE